MKIELEIGSKCVFLPRLHDFAGYNDRFMMGRYFFSSQKELEKKKELEEKKELERKKNVQRKEFNLRRDLFQKRTDDKCNKSI